jgi:predicted RecA/RadA family phage recombinase
MIMAYVTGKNGALGVPGFDLTAVDTVAKTLVGSRVGGFDNALGTGTFIYLQATVAFAAGDAGVFAVVPSTSAKTASGTHANSGRLVAVAVTAIPAGSFGWFQIAGVAIVNALAAAVGGKVFISATAGSLSTGVIAGCQVQGAAFESALGTPAAGQAYVFLSDSAVQTQIT